MAPDVYLHTDRAVDCTITALEQGFYKQIREQVITHFGCPTSSPINHLAVFQERVDSQVLCTWAKETNSGGCYPMVPFGQAMFPQKFIFLIDIKVPHRLVKASLMALMYI